MNNRGLTLVELLAVMAIIGLLGVMLTPTVISLRNNVLESTYKTRVSQIESAAKDYASDHINLIPQSIPSDEVLTDEDFRTDDYKHDYTCCGTISVNYLISSGYLAATNSYTTSEGQKKENQIINPITGEIANENTNKATIMYYIKGTQPNALDNDSTIPTIKEKEN